MLVVSRGTAGIAFLLTLLVAGTPAAAQAPPLPPAAIGQIIDEVLEALLSPSDSLSRVPIGTRTIYLDSERTLSAFGHLSNAKQLQSELGLKRRVSPAFPGLLSDCDQLARGPCASIGSGIYVSIRPVTISEAEATVSVVVHWASRRTASIAGGDARQSASLVGFGREVFLARSPDGDWKFARGGSWMVF